MSYFVFLSSWCTASSCLLVFCPACVLLLTLFFVAYRLPVSRHAQFCWLTTVFRCSYCHYFGHFTTVCVWLCVSCIGDIIFLFRCAPTLLIYIRISVLVTVYMWSSYKHRSFGCVFGRIWMSWFVPRFVHLVELQPCFSSVTALMFSSYNRLIIYFLSVVYTDVSVSPVMRHLLLSYSHVLMWLLPICIVITVIVFILVVFVLYTEVLFFTIFPPCCTASFQLLLFNLWVTELVYRVLLPLVLVFTTFWHCCLLVGRVTALRSSCSP
jgi:hypothetical protein